MADDPVRLFRDEAVKAVLVSFDFRRRARDTVDPFADGDQEGASRTTGRFAIGAAAAAFGGIAIAALLFVRPALDWPVAEPQMIQGRQVMEATGRVTSLDSASVVVSPTLLGFNGRRFLLDPETRVLVGDREGGIGDLQIGAPVAVIYEPRAGGLVARWLGLNLDRQAFRDAALRLDTATGEPERPARPNQKAATSGTRVERALRPPTAAAPPPLVVPVDQQSEDPGAVIDWLLRGTGRR